MRMDEAAYARREAVEKERVGKNATIDVESADDSAPPQRAETVDDASTRTSSEASSEVAPAVHVREDDCIELRRLHRFFGPTKAVDDISFTVQTRARVRLHRTQRRRQDNVDADSGDA